jgi:ribose 5-phosphate isomerase B
MKIWFAADHAGFELKTTLIRFLQARGFETHDCGTYTGERCDYPTYVHQLCQSLADKPEDIGILICGSGNGVCMTANKYSYIRAALAWNVEIAQLAKAHNHANILCLPARFISTEEARACVVAFLETPPEGDRHAARVLQIPIPKQM